ncbi:CRISPR-associated helicase Cas3' [Hominibacterium faecale]|uniref:CRISPR-associated helicase Cas3' n=1 Tax=Hominibacterium faecale TaxID=2839743 RepID=UPI0022B29679|nr:CRISPR-associated helicase Cas3' [Hominibacterium faecale]
MLPDHLLEDSLAKSKPAQSIREHTDLVKHAAQNLIDLGCIRSDHVAELLLIACEHHDYGKIIGEFQRRIKKGYPFNEAREVAHNILSYFFLGEDEFNNMEDYYIVAAAVLYHHCRDSISHNMSEKSDLIDALLEPYQEYIKKDLFIKDAECYEVLRERHPDAILVKGLLHRCDYSASAGIACEYPHDFLEQDMDALLKRWQSNDTKADWKDLQIFCLEHKDENLLITAPTGMGKTEAALLWIGNNKGFFVLPLRTAINAMYDRIQEEIIRGKKDECLALLHADTISYYLNQKERIDGSEDPLEYYTRSRQMALPLTICTLDQLFNFVYKYPGYEYKLATLSYSKIVIDEIQVYNPELLAYLVFGVRWIKQMGGKVAVLTATMPPFAKQKLAEALEGDFVEADFSHQGKDRHNIKVLDKALNTEDITDLFEKMKAGHCRGNSILVVCNSIEIAQQMYEQLSKKLDEQDAEVNLLHSNFTLADRKQKESNILQDGKTGEGGDKIKVWVATSIVEASLDIDFDYLFTELMDLFSLFQRLGRCNRKAEKPIDQYNCYVYLEKQGAVMKYVDETIFQCSRDALLAVDGILTEQEKTAMIEQALSVKKLENSDYKKEYERIYDYIEDLYVGEKDEREARLRNIQSVTVIPGPVYKANEPFFTEKQKTLKEGRLSIEERAHIRDAIYQHTVSIQRYRYEQSETFGEIALSRKEKLPILDCEYTKEQGLGIKKREKKAAPDPFI